MIMTLEKYFDVFSLVWSLEVIRGHSWSFVVTRRQSWSLVDTRGYWCVLLDTIFLYRLER